MRRILHAFITFAACLLASECVTLDSNFTAWLDDLGVERNPNVLLSRSASTGRLLRFRVLAAATRQQPGLKCRLRRATTSLAAGTTIARVPLRAMINVEHALASVELGGTLKLGQRTIRLTGSSYSGMRCRAVVGRRRA